ncbi:hypothetical protein [Aurantibacillus circumpalustris]|uniref:hypothetical protein n=1 Tax=Aurantibacillus circumpalustris TaxID=3036359 RepID=UPI00295A873B|nr:hypothetical protein [Aurantibacillus circumpalustris]
MRPKKIILNIWFLLVYCSVYAQTYPSSLSTILTNPKTLFLDEYADPFQPHIKTTIYFTDFTETTWNFALRLKITGPNGIVIQTKPNSLPTNPIIVAPGQPYEIQGADLAFYFNYDNLNFTNISRTQLETNNRLPEGLYTFCFEAIDYESGKAISHPACASAYLTLNDPAIIFNPVCGSVVENISLQNIIFQWQLSNANGNLNLNQLSYQIDLYEVNNSWSNPTTAILNNQALPIWQSALLQQNNYLYTTSDPLLEKGKRYVFTVKTLESNGRSSFKNGGYSMPCYFHYGYYENDTIDIVKPEESFQFALATPSEFKWKKPRKALNNQLITYTLKLVEVNENQDPENAILNNSTFYQQTYLPSNNPVIDKTIPVMFWTNIKRMGNYAWQVYAQSGTQQIAKSKVHRFTGPPEIESFIAGGFLMTVTKLTSFDKINNVISGKCKTVLNSNIGNEATEFSYNNITISPLGGNEWVMLSGNIADKITCPAYTLQPESFADNKTALFKPDSVFIDISSLRLSGKVEWNFPHAGTSQQIEKLITKRCKLTLSNSTFYLNNNYAIPLEKDYKINVMEPLGFTVKLNQSSDLNVYQNKYEFKFNGFVQLPQNVSSHNNTSANIAFENTNQLHYITQDSNTNSESIKLAQNTKFGLLPTHYIIDFSEKKSPGEFASDSSWKGFFIEQGKLEMPKSAENSGQITLPYSKELNFINTLQDTNKAYVTNKGLYFTSTIPFALSDSIKFNTFVSKLGYFYSKIRASEIDRAFISGGIYIPVIDTLNSFPYYIEMTDYGFNEGYLVNGLANTTFSFNPQGGIEQKIAITIKRAVFKNKNRLEMDLDMRWPYFQLNIIGVQRFSAWGNGNIGFDVPNGKAALTYQATGKSSNYDISVDYLGCGRNGNAYAFGASAKINLDEEISGEDGPPIVNAYSIYRNPLLTGLVFIPTATIIPTSSTTTGSATTTSHQSSTAGYSNALNNGVGDALTQLGYNANDTIVSGQFETKNIEPLIPSNVVTTIKQVIDIVYKLKPYIKSESITDKDWMVLDRFRKALDSDIIQQSQLTNAKGLLNFILNKVVDGLIAEINQSVQNVSDKAMGKVRTAINGKVVAPINNKIDKTLDNVFKKLEQRVLAEVDAQYHEAITSVFATVKTNVINGIKTSVSNSFEKNITSKITDFVQLGVTSKVKQFIKTEVSAAGTKLINDGVNANINLNNILQNSGTLFESIADTVKDVIVNANAEAFINTAESLVEDAINGINWDGIVAQIMNDLITKGISQLVTNTITKAIGDNAGPYVNAVLSTVKFDFSNLGEKLEKGEFDKIVKFDPTTIYIQSPAVDIRGTLEFKKDDPVYGDCWSADVLVRVKVPKEDNPIEISAYFLNGKTTQQPVNFSYWYAKLSVTGFTIPLTPMPIVWYGVEGFAYSKMQRTDPATVIPNKQNKFGVGCKFYFYDQASAGKTFMFDLGAEAEFNDGGFYIQLVGNASVLNYQKTNGRYHPPGFITGSGTLGYYKTPECKKVAANFSVKLNTEPIICAGGDIGMDLRGPDNWKVWVGTQQNPIGVKILCKDFLSSTAFMELSNIGFKTGMDMQVKLSTESPWIQFSGIKVRGFASLDMGYHAYTSISWDPTFTINEATISAWLTAAIGIDYETSVAANSLTLAGISLAGSLTYKSQPESELHGGLSGSITVIGFTLGFDAPVHYSLSKKQIIN